MSKRYEADPRLIEEAVHQTVLREGFMIDFLGQQLARTSLFRNVRERRQRAARAAVTNIFEKITVNAYKAAVADVVRALQPPTVFDYESIALADDKPMEVTQPVLAEDLPIEVSQTPLLPIEGGRDE